MPLLVILLPSADSHGVEHASGEPGPSSGVGDCHIGDVLPRLVGHPGDELEHPELLERSSASIGQVHRREQRFRRQPRATPRRRQRF